MYMVTIQVQGVIDINTKVASGLLSSKPKEQPELSPYILPELQHKPRPLLQASSPTPAERSKSARCQRPAASLLCKLT